MTRSVRRQWLTYVLIILAQSPIAGAQVYGSWDESKLEQLSQKLEKNICIQRVVPKEPPTNGSADQKDHEDSETEGAYCEGCSKPGHAELTEQATELSEAVSYEQLAREIAFFRFYDSRNYQQSYLDEDDMASVQKHIGIQKKEKADQEKVLTLLLEKAKTLEEAAEAIGIVRSGNTPTASQRSALVLLVDTALMNYKEMGAGYKAELDNLKDLMKSMASKKTEDWKSLKQEVVDANEHVSSALKDNKNAILDLTKLKKWLGKATSQEPPPDVLAALEMVEIPSDIEPQIDDRKEAIEALGSSIANLEERLMTLKANSPPTPMFEEGVNLATLRHYEKLFGGDSNFGSPECGLSRAERLAISLYTGDGYGEFNSALREGGKKAEEFRPFDVVLREALRKLRPYKGNVRRGADLPPDVLKLHKVGAIIEYKSWSSASIGNGFPASHRFIIKSKSGRYVAPFSNHPSEYEVLIPPGKFKILSRKKIGDDIEFVMREL